MMFVFNQTPSTIPGAIHYVWDIGLGLEIFEGAFSPKKSSASFKSGAAVASYRQVEQDLSTNAGTKSKEINF